MGQVAEFPRVSKLSEIALKTIGSHGVPPAPHNYTVWFTYVSGLEPELSREINARIAANQPFTDQARPSSMSGSATSGGTSVCCSRPAPSSTTLSSASSK